MRKFLSLILALCLVFSFAAFAQEPADEPITFEGPYVVTSAGQSADYKMVSTMLKMNKVENYLFPGFIAKKLLVKRPEKEVSSLRFYLKVLTNI